MLVIKAILILFSVVKVEHRSALVELFLTPMCANIGEHSNDTEFLLVCGRGLTHLARQDPDVFRMQVPLLTEQHRILLQQVMKLALQQQQSGEGAGGANNNSNSTNSSSNSNSAGSNASSAATGGIGKPGSMQINMSKYKK